MYYKINNNVMYRLYDSYGYITDNTMFGYRYMDDKTIYPGEEYVSESGAIMLNALSKVPKHIDDIVKYLLTIFVDVDYAELKNDTIDFFNYFVEKGFLSCGHSFDECQRCIAYDEEQLIDNHTPILSGDCSNTTVCEFDYLRSLHIEVANECNERCIHCYIPHEFKTKMMNPTLFYRLVEEAREMNMINITISGGEPLMHKDFIGFLKKCRELDMSVNVLSNLTLLTNEIATEMKANPLLSVQTSIYSMTPSIHDSITKIKGSFERTKAALLKLKDLGIPLQISCPIMKQNLDTFTDVISFGKENGIAVSVDYVIFASYDHSNCNLANRLSLEEVGQAFDKQQSEQYIDALQELAKEKLILKGDDSICTICQYYICVSAEGKAFPCIGWQEKIVGDLNKQSLKEVCEHSKEIKELKMIKRSDFPNCVECENRGYCTVCMMSNSNESKNNDPFEINDYHCKVAALIHDKVNLYQADK